MDTIFIEQLAVDAVIGVYDWERETTQRLFIDLDIGFSIRDAAADDDVDQTLDYQAVAERVHAFASASRYHLIETLAEEIARLLLTDFEAFKATVRISKPGAVPQAANVGVRVTRSSEA
ncbi:dihydroneopterin aldolase [Salinisphaera sp.]|uniref:dihydroneopterin aldolase n=1 Tax=Salinisphaera sp. TaxID=1914330 RepID=UPI000C3B4105|nr:dihydroneopterin aldolase [Salinisphaera sp.]MBS62361.1 dihydroneopterin aldolase [Salinisphaera sp.]